MKLVFSQENMVICTETYGKSAFSDENARAIREIGVSGGRRSGHDGYGGPITEKK